MSKKLRKKEWLVDGESVSLDSLREDARDYSLRKALGDYVSSKDLYARIDISATSLRRWRESGKVRARKVKSTWYYSRSDLLTVLRDREQVEEGKT